MEAFNWTCPHCERAVTIYDGRMSTVRHTLDNANIEGIRSLFTTFIVCPNPSCQKFTLTASLYPSEKNGRGGYIHGDKIIEWDLIPAANIKSFPSYIPHVILDDYREASLIRELSPKASATLSRRCLQGIIRDFWNVKPGRLVDEIKQIKPHVDSLTWAAIEAVRALGNIGAHMEKDIDIIIDVDPGEADLMIGLIETLLREWYIAKAERTARMGALVSAASQKP